MTVPGSPPDPRPVRGGFWLSILAGLSILCPCAAPAEAGIPSTREEFALCLRGEDPPPEGRWLIRTTRNRGSKSVSTTRCYQVFADDIWEVLRGDTWGLLEDVDRAGIPEPKSDWVLFRDGTFVVSTAHNGERRTDIIQLPDGLVGERGVKRYPKMHAELNRRLAPLKVATSSRTASGANEMSVLSAPVFLIRGHPDGRGFDVVLAIEPKSPDLPRTILFEQWEWSGDSGFPVESLAYVDAPGAIRHAEGNQPRNAPATISSSRRSRLASGTDGERFARLSEQSSWDVPAESGPVPVTDWASADAFVAWSKAWTSRGPDQTLVLEVLDFDGEVVLPPKSEPRPGTIVMVYQHDGDSLTPGELLDSYAIRADGTSEPTEEAE